MHTVEEKLVGLAIKLPSAFEKAADAGLKSEHFENQTMATIWTAILTLAARDCQIDINTVCSQIPSLEQIVIELTEVPFSGEAELFAKSIIASDWARKSREKLSALNKAFMRRGVLDPTDDLMEETEKTMLEITGSVRASRGNLFDASDCVIDAINRIEEAYEAHTNNRAIGIPTSLKMLDRSIGGGWRRGSMYIIAARPGQGKSTLAMQAMFKAAELGYKCVYFTVEMLRGQLLQKYPSSRLEINCSLIHSGIMDKEQCDQITAAFNRAASLPFWICDDFGASFERMKAALSRQVKRVGVDLIVVDYIGQIRIDSKPKLSKREVIEEVSAWLKAFALQHKCVVLTVAQINRMAESSEEGPELWHLKDSGSLEQDCDMAVLIHRTEEKEIVDGKDRKLIPQRCRLKIRKNRWGIDNDIEVNSEFQYSRFTDKEFTR
jgi:replicative DNA helicase